MGHSDGKKVYRIALPSGEVIEAADVVFVEDSNTRRPPSPDTGPNQHEMVDLDQEETDDGPDPDPAEEDDDPEAEPEGGEPDNEPDDPDPGAQGGQGAGPHASQRLQANARYPRGARNRRPPVENWRVNPEIAAAAAVEKPLTFEEAVASEQADEWRQAMDEEIKSLHANDTWTTEPIPKGMRAIPVKWVYKVKRVANGNIERFKARLVAKGFRQREGVDFDEVFAPVSKYSTLRTLMAVAAVENLKVHQFDIKTAFLNGILEEEVFIELAACRLS